MKKIAKKRVKKKDKSSKEEEPVRYTKDIKSEIDKVKILFKKKHINEERYDKNLEKYRQEKQKLMKDIENLGAKKKLEEANLKKLIEYMKKTK